MFPGSNWWSFDFHNHTPASSDYHPLEKVQLTPRDWLLAYMRAGVDCVAITDHNSGDWIDRLKQELAVMGGEQPAHPDYRKIHLFPGVEITSSEGLHILAIYGPEDGVAKIHGLLTLAQYNGDTNNAHGMCNVGASIICDHIHQEGGIVVLAHAEEINGIFQGIVDTGGQFRPTRSDRSIEQILEKADAIEVHDEASPAIIHFATKLTGRAVVDGSDAHSTNNAGIRSVWLKMAQPCIEGLKLALLDPASSITRSLNKPTAPLHRITSLRVEQLHLRRQSLNILFSPWFNAIIGGRGSGKSTLLEALRLALGRESDIGELGTDQESDVVRAFKRFRTVGGVRGNYGMIKQDTVLSGTVEKFDPSTNTNEEYSFTWRHNGFHVQRKNERGAWEDTGLNVEQAGKFFPVKVFSQKQIFELAERPSALLTYIDRTPEVGFRDWQEAYNQIAHELRGQRSEERTLLHAIEKKAELEAELREVSRKALAYQQSNVAQQLQVFKDNQQAQQVVHSFIEGMSAPIQAIETLLNTESPYGTLEMGQITLQIPDQSNIRRESESVARDLGAKYGIVRQTIAEMRERLELFEKSQPVIDYLQKTDDAITAYRAEVERLKGEGIGTAQEAEAALQRKQELGVALANIASQEAQLSVLRRKTLATYAKLKFHRRKLTKLRRMFVNQVLMSNPNLRITIDEQADVYQSKDQFRSILRLQDGTFVEDILSIDDATGQYLGLLGKLVSNEIHNPIHKRVTSLKAGILERDKEILGQAVHGRLVSALSRLSSDDEDALLEWFPEDLVRVEFRRNSSESFQSLERASAGQKTSSVLSFLLSHGTEPLLLDQPEDDLDNALVSELVVDQIRNNKSRRQIIVVTHNPNIVVNGDAELVLPMAFAAGQIQQNNAGGLQEKAVRHQICDIMEGGRDAFRQRYKRILEDLDV